MSARTKASILLVSLCTLCSVITCQPSSIYQSSINTAQCSEDDLVFECLCKGKHIKVLRRSATCLRDSNWNKSQVIVSRTHCIWYNNVTSELLGGMCPFGRIPSEVNFSTSHKVGEVNSMICGEGHTGRLCGQCSQGYSLVFTSYLYKCKKSCNLLYWPLFFFQQLLPALVFFMLFIFVDVKGILEYMNGFILGAQVASCQLNLLAIHTGMTYVFNSSSVWPRILTQIFASLYSMWNLNFFFGITPSYCIRNNLNALQSLTLYYMNGVFPIIVVFIVYTTTELHRHNYRVIVRLWQPFHLCFTRFRRKLNPKTSITDALAIFITLSYTKFVVISCMILAPNYLTAINGTTSDLVFLYDGTVNYLSNDHVPYVIVALLVALFFVLPLPLLLLIYPMSCFQKCLNRLNLRNHLLTAFTDAMHGFFKDGSNNTRDCRYFAALYFILRIIINSLYSLLYTNPYIMYISTIAVLTITLMLLICFKPYKRDSVNKLECLILAFFIFVLVFTIFQKIFQNNKHHKTAVDYLQISILYLLLILPVICLVSSLICRCAMKLYKKRRPHLSTGSTSVDYEDSLLRLIIENQKTYDST